jgi:isoquinoline 1-oxidoreductase beta subunit
LRRFLRFTRVVAAVDLGVAVNPDVVMAQIEGSIGFALSMVLRYAAKRHRPAEQFRRLRADRIREMPKVEVHIPTGIWKPDLSPVASAIGNAVAAATCKRLHTLPLGLTTLSG